MGFLEVVDGDGDVCAIDEVVVDADRSFEVGRVPGVSGDGLEALRDVGGPAAGVEGERRLAWLLGLPLAVTNGDLPQPAALVGDVVVLEDEAGVHGRDGGFNEAANDGIAFGPIDHID
jgi:hypothetical protein